MKKDKQITIKLPASRYINVIYAVILLFAGLLLYSKSATMGLIYADDNQIIAFAYSEEFSTDRILNQFSKSTGNAFYRPLLDISFIIDGAMLENRIEPFSFHRTNIILHLAAVIIAYFVFLTLGYNRTVSLFASMIYLAHPLLTPAVSWISGRNDSMLSVFLLLSFLLFLLYDKEKTAIKYGYLLLVLLFFAMAMFTKETAVVFPFLLVLYNILAKKKPIVSRNNIIFFASMVIIALIWFILRQNALSGGESEQTFSLSNFLYNLPALFAFAGKIILPFEMAATSYFSTLSYISGIIAYGLFVLPIILNKNLDRKYYYFGMLWFLLPLLTTMFFRLPEGVAYFDYVEHRAYFPMFGILLSLLVLTDAYKVDFKKPIVLGVSSIVIIALVVASFLYQDVFENRMSYWSKIVKLKPDEPRAYYNIGAAYNSENKLDTAEVVLKKGLSLDTTKNFCYRELSLVYMKRRDWLTAYQYGLQSLNRDSNDLMSNYYLGKTMLNLQRFIKAIEYFQKAEKMGYLNPDMFIDIGYAFTQIRKYEKAIEYYQKALSIQPNALFAYSNLGDLYLSMKRYDLAKDAYLKSLAINNKLVQSYDGLINLHIEIEDWQSAYFYAEQFRKIGGSLNPEVVDLINQKIASKQNRNISN